MGVNCQTYTRGDNFVILLISTETDAPNDVDEEEKDVGSDSQVM